MLTVDEQTYLDSPLKIPHRDMCFAQSARLLFKLNYINFILSAA